VDPKRHRELIAPPCGRVPGALLDRVEAIRDRPLVHPQKRSGMGGILSESEVGAERLSQLCRSRVRRRERPKRTFCGSRAVLDDGSSLVSPAWWADLALP
jgi:hypothetical protein